MKKIVSAIIIFTVLLHSFMPQISFASDAYNGTKESTPDEMLTTLDSAEKIIEGGEVDYAGQSAYPRGTQNTGNAITTTLSSILTVFSKAASLLMSSIVHSETKAGQYKLTPDGPFTIENLVFGMIEIFDANFFSYNSNVANTAIKENVQTWYVTTRVIAIAISIVTLIYMGIRMAISSVASEKAKYKDMLTGWIFSFALIFILHYILIAMSNLSDGLTFLFTANANQITMEEQVMIERDSRIAGTNGWNMATEVVLYMALVFYQLKFFIMYFKRLLVIGFLIVISPLITITYAIDKAGDGRAQAFSTWLREISVNIFIQPFHALFYMVFIYSASEIAVASPIVAIIFFMALSRSEKIVKGIFNLRGLQTIHSMSEYFKIGRGGN